MHPVRSGVLSDNSCGEAALVLALRLPAFSMRIESVLAACNIGASAGCTASRGASVGRPRTKQALNGTCRGQRRPSRRLLLASRSGLDRGRGRRFARGGAAVGAANTGKCDGGDVTHHQVWARSRLGLAGVPPRGTNSIGVPWAEGVQPGSCLARAACAGRISHYRRPELRRPRRRSHRRVG